MFSQPESRRFAAGLAKAGAYSTCKVHDWPAGKVVPLQLSPLCRFMKLEVIPTLPNDTLTALELVNVTGLGGTRCALGLRRRKRDEGL